MKPIHQRRFINSVLKIVRKSRGESVEMVLDIGDDKSADGSRLRGGSRPRGGRRASHNRAASSSITTNSSTLTVEFSEIKSLTYLASGGHADIYLARWNNQPVAVKIVRDGLGEAQQAAFTDFLNEKSVLMLMRHHPGARYVVVLKRLAGGSAVVVVVVEPHCHSRHSPPWALGTAAAATTTTTTTTTYH